MRDTLRDEVDLALLAIYLGKDFNPNEPRDPHTGEWIGTPGVDFPKPELDALLAYQEGGSDVSELLRGIPLHPARRPERVQAVIEQMDHAMDRAGPLGKPVRAWRGLNTLSMEDNNRVPSWVHNPQELNGKVIEDPAFASTTTIDEVAFESAGQTAKGADEIMLDLDVDPRVRGIDMSRLPGTTYEEQKELLLERGVRMLVLGVERKKQPWGWVSYIRVKVLPPK